MNPQLYERLWRLYVAPKGRLGNKLQGAALKTVETARLAPRISRAQTIVLVHSQGKVGSSAMYDALSANFASESSLVFQTHNIRSPHDLREVEDRRHLAPRRTFYTTDLLHPLIKGRIEGDKKFIVVSAVRDPIDRMISDYFQNLERYTPERQYPKPGEHSVDDYLEWFRNEFDVFRGADWFSEQFEDLFGVRLTSEQFDHEVGFQTFESPNVTAGVVRFDRIKDSWPEYSNALLGTHVELDRTNDSSEKAYGHVYSEFKKRLSLSADSVESIYDLPYVKHFYTIEERAAAVQRWSA